MAIPHRSRQLALFALPALALAVPGAAAAVAGPAIGATPELLGVPVEFLLFGLTLLGVAIFHHRTFEVAVTGLGAITIYKLVFAGFRDGPGLAGLVAHLGHEWVIVANLALLLMGFGLLADHFERSELPRVLPHYLPDDWKGAFALLAIVFVLSAFLDNIAAALIGGAMAHTVFRQKVHIGYLAALVACANAGGAGSVIGDTTTTMMWVSGISPVAVLHATIASVVALVVCGIPASFQQTRYSPILKDTPRDTHIDWARVAVVGVILASAIAVNVYVNMVHPAQAESFPFIGVAIWLALVAMVPIRKPSWSLLPEAARGSSFLLSLVLAATMMPVDRLPLPSWQTAFGLGFLSAVFDNIPLTALAIRQGGYDWGVLAYAVGFGGSMVWFGTSAGVAISDMFPEARSVGAWIRHGWHVALAYVAGFFVLLALLGWHPSDRRVDRQPATAPATVHALPAR